MKKAASETKEKVMTFFEKNERNVINNNIKRDYYKPIITEEAIILNIKASMKKGKHNQSQ